LHEATYLVGRCSRLCRFKGIAVFLLQFFHD
jgi:hypothetical protein